jgi:hypothetical protein
LPQNFLGKYVSSTDLHGKIRIHRVPLYTSLSANIPTCPAYIFYPEYSIIVACRFEGLSSVKLEGMVMTEDANAQPGSKLSDESMQRLREAGSERRGYAHIALLEETTAQETDDPRSPNPPFGGLWK